MLTLWGSRYRCCDAISRRNFLQIGALGAGLTLADMLRLRATAGTTSRPNKAAVMIFLRGGPSHIDTYDLKPDAPVGIRGEFKPIATRVPGIEVCELLPRHAAIMDKLAVVRSITGMVNEHEDSHVMTGYTVPENKGVGRPSFGAVVSKLRSEGHPGVPQFVSLRGEPSDIFESSRVGLFPGYLGLAHGPFVPHGQIMRDLRLAPGVSAQRLGDRKALLSSLDTLRRDLDAHGVLNALDSHTARAFEMIASSSVRNALDLGKEPLATRERYRGFEQLLTARRLVEAGVGCVTVSIGSNGWDHHIANFKLLRQGLPEYDAAIATFIQDLHDRGLDRDVVTIAWGEFGRAPVINGNQGGRDHWTGAMSALIAGGGLRMGQVVGSTDSRADRPKDRPYRIQNILSTLYRVLEIDPALTFPDRTGRPVALLDDREPVVELL
jgi:hypothetical protein